MPNHSLRTLISEEEIQLRVHELAEQIAADFPDGTLYLVGVLKGSFVFLSDLARAIPFSAPLGFIAASSYGSETVSSGEVRVTAELADSIEGADVLLVEDIVDTGNTLAYLLAHLARKRPKSLRVVSLLDKPSRRSRAVKIDYVGFAIPDEFVVGYGMDYAEDYRNLADICVLEAEA